MAKKIAKLPRLLAMDIEDRIMDHGLHGYLMLYDLMQGDTLDDTSLHELISDYAILFSRIEYGLRQLGVDTTIGYDET